MAAALPLIILAGNDPRPPRMPTGSDGLHPLVGTKAVDIRVAGRPLIEWVVERARLSGRFAPIFVGGAAERFAELDIGDAEVIDTDGTFGENIRCTLETLAARCPGQSVAFLTCDVLPEPEELARLMADYDAHAPLDFWFPTILAPATDESLGASAWKPRYRLAHRRGEPPFSVLPGHAIVVAPDALRLPLLFRGFELAYGTRNQPIVPRLWRIVRALVANLVGQDLRLMLRGVLPTLTVSVIGHGIALAYRLRRGEMSAEELSIRFDRMFVRRRQRRLHPESRGRVFLIDTLSLAKDIDTVEEARELSRNLAEPAD